MNIIVKHIIGGVIFLAVSVGAAFGAFKYGEYVGNERATEELNRFKGILSKTEETKSFLISLLSHLIINTKAPPIKAINK